jgi:predicted RNA-binding protein YlqC (UPF0109 family)
VILLGVSLFQGNRGAVPADRHSYPEDLTQIEAIGMKEPGSAYFHEVSVMNEAMPTAIEPTERMKHLILEIVQSLVDQPDDVSVEMLDDHDSTVIRLRVAHQDIGKVIGKQGRTARSLRTILGAASMKLHHRFALDILEDGEPGRQAE